MSNLTYNVRLATDNQEEFDLLYSMLLEHQKVWRYLSEFVFDNGIIDKKIIHDKNYHKCRKLFPDCPSQVIIRAKDSVYATYKTIKANNQLDSISEPAQLNNLSIRLDKRIYTFLPDNKIRLTTTGKRINCSYTSYDKFEELFSKYAVCDPLIFFRDNEFWLAVSFEVPTPTVVENSCIGVDLGIKRTFVTSEGIAFKDKLFLKEQRRLRYLKRVLQSKHQISKSRSGDKKLKSLKRKEHNKNLNQTHKIANEILKTKSNVVVMEDLTKIKSKSRGRKFNNKQSQVPYFDLRRILTYKAPLKGKTVVTVDPAYTSKNDYTGQKRGIRKGCRYYTTDNKVYDADWNASINIANRYSRIKNQNGVELPVSFSTPFDGGLNFIGRPHQLANREIRSRKSNELIIR